MRENYRKRIYEKYITNQFSGFMDLAKIEREWSLLELYFRKNYLPHMPVNKNAAIIDVGCGMGAFLNFCKVLGYSNASGIDLSVENVDFCKSRGLSANVADIFEHFKCSSLKYNCIVLNDVIEHLSHQEVFDALELMKNSLCESGGGC